MQQTPQPRPHDLFGAFRPQHGCKHVAPDRTLRFGQIDQQGEASCASASEHSRSSRRISGNPSVRTLNRAIVMRPAMRASGDAQGTGRWYHVGETIIAESVATVSSAPSLSGSRISKHGDRGRAQTRGRAS